MAGHAAARRYAGASGARRAPGPALVDLLGHHPSIALGAPTTNPRLLRPGSGPSGWRWPSTARLEPERARHVGHPGLGAGRRVPAGGERSAPRPRVGGGRRGSLPHLAEMIRASPGVRERVRRRLGPVGRRRRLRRARALARPRLDDLAAHHGLDREAMGEQVPPAASTPSTGGAARTQRTRPRSSATTSEDLRRIKYQPTGGFVMARLTDARGHHAVSARPQRRPSGVRRCRRAVRSSWWPTGRRTTRRPAGAGSTWCPTAAPHRRRRAHRHAVLGRRLPCVALGRGRGRRLRAGRFIAPCCPTPRGRHARPVCELAGWRTGDEPLPGHRHFSPPVDL